MKFSDFAKGGVSGLGKTTYVPGDWNAIDDRTGFQHKASELSRQWDGAMVIDPEERHPQDFLRNTPDRIKVPWSRPDLSDADAPVVVVLPSQIRSNG